MSAPHRPLAGVLVALALGAGPARADPSSAEVERRLDEQERRLGLQQRRLEEQERELEGLREELRGARTSSRERDGAWQFGGYGLPDPARDRRLRLGLFFVEGNGHRLELRGRLHLDARLVPEHGRDDVDNSFLVRRARIELRGVLWRRLAYEVSCDFGEAEVALADGWLELRALDALRVRVGQQRLPFSLSRMTSSNEFFHPERPIGAGALVESREIGAMFHGGVLGGRLRYYVGIYNGMGANVEQDEDDDFDVAVRLEGRPIDWLQLGACLIYTPTDHDAEGPSDVATVGDKVTEFLDYDGDNRRRSHRLRFGGDLRLRVGPFELSGEAIHDTHFEVRNQDANLEDLSALAVSVDAALLLTGEDRQDVIDPKRPLFSEGEWGWGAWELALRYESFRVDEETIEGEFAEGTDRVDSFTATLGWYPWRAVHLMISYSFTKFADTVTPSAGRALDDDHVVITRLAAYW